MAMTCRGLLSRPLRLADSLLRSSARFGRRSLTTTTGTLEEAYQRTKELCLSKKLPRDVKPEAVFACNELDLGEVNVYGFDYDYTLACYKPSLDDLLYELGRTNLINKFKYPKEIADLKYIPNFAVRGLHYDIEKGLLLKLDSFLQIQLGSVYRGLSPVSDEEVLELYKNRIIPIAYVEGTKNSAQKVQNPGVKTKMVQLADLFSVPEMLLLCQVAEFFRAHSLDYHPEILFHDVKTAVQGAHPIMHKIVAENVTEYLECNPNIRRYFQHLAANGKKLFLVTNSPFHFVDKGMRYIVGNDWKNFFDVTIVQARKPKFFTDESRPIRLYDTVSRTQLWDRVTRLEKGKIYFEGTINQLQDMTGWKGHQVLYFGDHPYSDLADVTLQHGWRTGAIISELDHEIKTLNNEKFKKDVNWLQMLTQLIEDCQDREGKEAEATLQQWMQERDMLSQKTKTVFNKQFGSVFRTYQNPSYFSRRLFRFADIYTSSISNLMHYSASHTFYPRRGVMPHEYTSYFV
ncbi:5'-nucleotidase domain-containing protein 3 isoform X2 [Cloeon dipterum]|uniref:5'-nucleotidase domain-containing protein 3 isoform X2 n=1 Tax=Cloeon dipterum TaxID=197152 RepID=UPI003220417D